MTKVQTPRIEDTGAIHITGQSQTYFDDSSAVGVPKQWQEFAPHIGNIPGQIGEATFGVCWDEGGGVMSYICAVEADASVEALVGFTSVTLLPQRYAKFHHGNDLSTIRQTWQSISETWLPAAGLTRNGGPELEWYSPDFNPATGSGYVEIWIPVNS